MGMDIQYVILGSSLEMIYGMEWGTLWWECKWFCDMSACLFSKIQLHQWCRDPESKSYQYHTGSVHQVYPWYSVTPVERFTFRLDFGSSLPTNCKCEMMFSEGKRAGQVHSGKRGRVSTMKPCSKVILMKSSTCSEMQTLKMSRTIDTRISSFTFYVQDRKPISKLSHSWN